MYQEIHLKHESLLRQKAKRLKKGVIKRQADRMARKKADGGKTNTKVTSDNGKSN